MNCDTLQLDKPNYCDELRRTAMNCDTLQLDNPNYCDELR